MFRDLKEYQNIQKIYEDSVIDYLTEEEEDIIVSHLLEEDYTSEQIDELIEALENIETLSEASGAAAIVTKLGSLIGKAGKLKSLGPKALKFGKGFLNKLRGASKLKSGQFGGGIKTGIDLNPKKNVLGKNAKRNIALTGLVGAGAIKNQLEKAKKEQDKETDTKTDTKTDAKTDTKTDKGTSFGDAIKLNTPKPEGTKIGKTINITKEPEKKGRANVVDIKINSNKNTTDSKTSTKKMSQGEKDNRQKFGDKYVDRLKQKTADYKSYKKGDMTKSQFISKYPKSQTAKDEYIRKNPNSRQAMMQNSYKPEGTPIDETTGYNPTKNHHIENDLAEAYRKMYNTPVDQEDLKEQPLAGSTSKVGVANDTAATGNLVKKIGSGIKNTFKKVEPIKRLRSAISKIEVGSSTDSKKFTPFKKLAPESPIGANRDTSSEIESDATYAKTNQNMNKINKFGNRSTQEPVKSPSEAGMGDGASRARAMAKARIAAKKANPNQKQLSGRERAQALAKARIAARKGQMNNSFIPDGETIEERLGGKGVSKKAAAGSIYPGEKGDGQTEDQDRGEGNKAKRRAGEKVEKKSPTFMAYIKNKKDDKKDDNKMEAYDLVLDYLLSSQQVATIEEANYVMTEMDAKTIQNIVEDQKKKIDEKFNLGKVRILPALVKGGLAVGAYKLAFGDKGNNTNTNTNTKTDTSNITVDKVKKKNNNKNNLFKQGLDVIKQAQENPGTGLNPNTRKALELDKDYEEGKR